MSGRTAIAWTDATWNPWYGCRKVSPGCRGCYMYRDMARYGRPPSLVARSKSTFRDPLKWKDARRVFTCSWSDFFIEDADAWRGEAWDVIRATPQHNYQILTKRPENIAERLPADWGRGWRHVWLGVSAENQQYADLRIPILLDVPAAVRFVSAEPLLGPIHFGAWPELQWVIVGGESGHPRREMDMRWAEEIASACAQLGIPLFVKQDSGERPGAQRRIPDWLWREKAFPATHPHKPIGELPL